MWGSFAVIIRGSSPLGDYALKKNITRKIEDIPYGRPNKPTRTALVALGVGTRFRVQKATNDPVIETLAV